MMPQLAFHCCVKPSPAGAVATRPPSSDGSGNEPGHLATADGNPQKNPKHGQQMDNYVSVASGVLVRSATARCHRSGSNRYLLDGCRE